MDTVKNAKRLIKDLEKKRHPEYGMTKIKGCQLSSSDVDTAIMIAEEIVKEGGRYPSTLMPIYNTDIRNLYEKYNLPYQRSTAW